MPQKTAAMAETVAEQVALQKLQAEGTTTYICEVCGYVAKSGEPVQCPVCGSGAAQFVCLDPDTVEAMVAEEGGVEAEDAFDGLTLRWTLEAKEELRRIPVAYMRRRAKARIEKTARVRTLSTITRDFVLPIVNDSIVEAEAIGAAPNSQADQGQPPAATGQGTQLPATEASIRMGDFDWVESAIARLNRVPEGFMRDITRTKIEEYAGGLGLTAITLDVAEQGIEVGRQMMAEMIASYTKAKREGNGDAGHLGEAQPARAGRPTALNEVQSVQGIQP
jgi:hypothetical protein